ncbi:MAG: BPSS1780 family membrane protein [Burkholderiales bacterium]|nr:BPSS1780 family membrane protein [Burkholderiales bacterium]
MQAVSLPALSGWRWVRDGWMLFRKQPMAFFSWAMFVSLILMVASVTPPIGPLIFVVLMPTATLLSLSAARHAEQGQKVLLGTWIAPLRLAGVFRRLLGMGALYVLFCLLLGLIAFMPFSEEVTQAVKAVATSNDLLPLLEAVRTPMAIFAVLYVLMAAVFWYAPALVGWHSIPMTRALFYSGIACWRNKWAFGIYGLSWLAIFLAIDTVLSALTMVGLPKSFSAMIQVPVNVVASAVLYCSFYTSFISVFYSEPAPEPETTAAE